MTILQKGDKSQETIREMSALPALLKTLIHTSALGRRNITDTAEAAEALEIETTLKARLEKLEKARRASRPKSSRK